MNGSHGRAPRAGRAWLGATLAASGLFAASAPEAARACHINRNAPKPAGQAAITPATATAAVMPTATPAPIPSTSESFQQALQTFMNDWKHNVAPTPPAIVPTAAHATPPAAEMLTPSTTAPTVANQNTILPCGCPPPPPPCPTQVPANTTTVTPPAPQTLTPSPAGATATATPEPSTILSALAMVGAVAWRRRAVRSR